MENCWKHRNVNQTKTLWSFGIFFAWVVIWFNWNFVQFSHRSRERFHFCMINAQTPLVFFCVRSFGFFGRFFTNWSLVVRSFFPYLLPANLLFLLLPLLKFFFGGICSICLTGEILKMATQKLCSCLKDSMLHVFTMKCPISLTQAPTSIELLLRAFFLNFIPFLLQKRCVNNSGCHGNGLCFFTEVHKWLKNTFILKENWKKHSWLKTTITKLA